MTRIEPPCASKAGLSKAGLSKGVWPAARVRPRFVDVETWTSRTLDEGLRSEGWFGETFIVDGAPHFPDGTALIRYADGVAAPRFRHDTGWLQLVERIR